jgi:hypothetical protein
MLLLAALALLALHAGCFAALLWIADRELHQGDC